jgi:hypothetical protein
MKLRDKLTIGLIAGTGVIWIAWDVYLGAVGAPTESMWIAAWTRQANSLALFLGALVGHWAAQWFWKSAPHYGWWPVAAGILLAAVGWDVLCAAGLLGPPEWARYPGIWLAAGLPVGHVFWPQKYPEARP